MNIFVWNGKFWNGIWTFDTFQVKYFKFIHIYNSTIVNQPDIYKVKKKQWTGLWINIFLDPCNSNDLKWLYKHSFWKGETVYDTIGKIKISKKLSCKK